MEGVVALWILLCISGLGFPDDDLCFDITGPGNWRMRSLSTVAVFVVVISGFGGRCGRGSGKCYLGN